MSKYPNLLHPPITEAILDIQAELPDYVTLLKLLEFHNCDNIKKRFPKRLDKISGKTSLKFSSNGKLKESSSEGQTEGYFFKSSNENKIVQARINGFTFNKLKPYESWDVFQTEARELWDTYFEIANPVDIKRIALRYINRIEIPLPINNFKDYILTTVEIAPKLPQELARYFMQLVIPYPHINVNAIITQTIERSIKEYTLPLILDIDVFKNVSYKTNEKKIWDEFFELRNIKNDIFFNSITKTTEELLNK